MLNRKRSQGLFGFHLEDLTLKLASNRSESYAAVFVKSHDIYINA